MLKDTEPGGDTRGKTTQRDKSGDYEDAVDDFDKLPLLDVNDIDTKWGKGKTRKLNNGKSVSVRP